MRLAAADRDSKEVRALLIDEADAVQLVPEASDRAHARQVLCVLANRRVRHFRLLRLAGLRREEHRRPIGRPGWRPRAIAQFGQLGWLAAIQREDPDLPLVLARVALRH